MSLNLSDFQYLKSLLVCHHGLATKQSVIFVIMQPSVTTVTRRIQTCQKLEKKVSYTLSRLHFQANRKISAIRVPHISEAALKI